jgi:hypothetical protein
MTYKCSICKEPLKGEMLFYPEICLSCVIDHGSKDELNKLKKYEKWNREREQKINNEYKENTK